jgi:LacI family transcriptional regulator
MLEGEALSNIEVLLRSGRLDGIVIRLVQDPPATDALLELIAATQVPCVCIERPGAARFGFSAVTYDDHQGGQAATRYLLSQGHRRIAHLAGDQRYVTARARLDGYRSALAEGGLQIDEALIECNDWDVAAARLGVAQLVSLEDRPTAIFAASDSLAFAAIEELRSRHYRIPEDMAVIGFDDIELAGQMAPPLTTVRIPLRTIGQRAAELLCDTIEAEQGNGPHVENLPVELVLRGSA